MRWMARDLARRTSPQRLVPGARSVLCLAVGYAPAGPPAADEALVARYARGRDYHRVLKARCRALVARLRRLDPAFDGRAFVDAGPVMERTLAHLAGLGWIGRNGCLFAPGLGSYVLLCEIVSNLPLVPDAPIPSRCAECDACVRACPTGALVGDGLVDARRCISYLTIEHGGAVPAALWPGMGTGVFGCDACQAACPHNRDVPPGDEALRSGRPLGGASLAEILAWTDDDWDAATRGRATRRASRAMLLRNAVIAAGNGGDRALAGPLRRLADAGDLPEGLVGWALRRLEARAQVPRGQADR
jgi:epoxyqueuosine reductase